MALTREALLGRPVSRYALLAAIAAVHDEAPSAAETDWGEIVGLYGLIGAGRSEFVQCLFGRTHNTAGDVKLKGKAVEFRREADAIESGIVLLPESRRDQGLCLNLPVGFNLNLPVFHKISTGGLIRSGEEKTRSDKQMRDLRIVAASRSVERRTSTSGWRTTRGSAMAAKASAQPAGLRSPRFSRWARRPAR